MGEFPVPAPWSTKDLSDRQRRTLAGSGRFWESAAGVDSYIDRILVPGAAAVRAACADCRVLDMMEKSAGATIFDFPPPGAKG